MKIKKEIIQLDKKHVETAEDFANRRGDQGVEVYRKRGGFKKLDIVTGAMGEMAAFKLLKSMGYKTNRPDFTIHDKHRKSYSADLVSECGKHFHVKSQNVQSAKRYEPSYLMQRTDPLIKSPEKDHYIIPTIVDLDTNAVEIFGTIPVTKIIDNELLGECKIEWLRKTKVALYLKDLKTLSSKIRWEIK